MFDFGLTVMEERGVMDDLKDLFISPPSSCSAKKDASNLASSQISIQQVSDASSSLLHSTMPCTASMH